MRMSAVCDHVLFAASRGHQDCPSGRRQPHVIHPVPGTPPYPPNPLTTTMTLPCRQLGSLLHWFRVSLPRCNPNGRSCGLHFPSLQDYVLTSDVDLLPLSRTHFNTHRDWKHNGICTHDSPDILKYVFSLLSRKCGVGVSIGLDWVRVRARGSGDSPCTPVTPVRTGGVCVHLYNPFCCNPLVRNLKNKIVLGDSDTPRFE